MTIGCVFVVSPRARARHDVLSHINLCRTSLDCHQPPAFSTYQNEQRRLIPVKCLFEKPLFPNQIRAHSLMTQFCRQELTGRLSLCSMERIMYESQTTARSCTLSGKSLGGLRTLCPLGAFERVEKECARLKRVTVTARTASLRLCHRSSSRVETDALAHLPGVIRSPAGVAVVCRPLDPSPICRRLLGTYHEADALTCSYSE